MNKSVFFFFFSILSLANSHAQTNQPKVYAIVVGISKYLDESIPDLKYADKDAEAMAAFLRSPRAGAVPQQNISVLINEKATRSNILRDLVQIISRSSPEDLFIFYFSGHGKNDILENSGYLLTYDTENENEAGTALSMDDINSKIGHSKAKMKVAYIDACHAGLFKSSGTKGTAADNGEIASAYLAGLANASDGNVAFMASTARQQSLEDVKLGHGVFTYFLIKGLNGEADLEQKNTAGYNNGIVTVSELQTYLTRQIDEATNYKQKPGVEGNFDGEFPLSVIKEGVNLSAEVSKRPKTKQKNEPMANPLVSVKAPENEKLSAANTFSRPWCYGKCTIINRFNTPIRLTLVRGFYPIESDAIIAPNQSTTTPRITLFNGANTKEDCADRSYDCTFSFTIFENGKEKTAQVTLTIEAGVNYYLTLSPENLVFN